LRAANLLIRNHGADTEQLEVAAMTKGGTVAARRRAIEALTSATDGMPD
jgi:hypothetical protein